MPNVYFIGLFAVLIVSGLAGSYLKGRSDGTDITRSEYAQRDLQSASENAAQFKAITERYRAKEQAQATAIQSVSSKYQKEVANHETTKLAALAAINTGTLKLRLTDSSGCQASGGTTATTAASASGHSSEAGSQFLGQVDSAFLIAEASRADKIIGQLTACQDVLAKERL